MNDATAPPPEPTLPSDVVRARIRQVRKQHGWSLRELSNRLEELGVHMDPPTLVRIEVGQRRVLVDQMVALAAALDVSPSYLLHPPEDVPEIELAPGLIADRDEYAAWLRGLTPLPPQDSQVFEMARHELAPHDPQLAAEELRDLADRIRAWDTENGDVEDVEEVEE